MDKDLNIFQNAEVDLKVNGGPTNIGAFLGSYDKVILKPNKKGSKNVLEQWMLSAPHTKYVIKYDFTLEDTIIEMPNDAILEIDCGSLQHGTLIGKSTGLINANNTANALVDVTLNGSWNTQVIPDKPTGDGMGRVYLKQGVPLSEQMTQENTIYVIQYDFTLGEDITVPANCVLEFDGGSIGNSSGNSYYIDGNRGKINTEVGYHIFKDCDFKNFTLPYVDVRWVGGVADFDDKLHTGTDSSAAFKQAVDMVGKYYKGLRVKVIGKYFITNTVETIYDLDLEGCYNPVGDFRELESDVANGHASSINTSASICFKLLGHLPYSNCNFHINNLYMRGIDGTETFIQYKGSGPDREGVVENCRFYTLTKFLEFIAAADTQLFNVVINQCTAQVVGKVLYSTYEGNVNNRTLGNVRITNCNFTHSFNDFMIDIYKPYGAVTIDNNCFENSDTPNPIRIQDWRSSIIISNNYFEGNPGYHITVAGTGYASRLQIFGNLADNNSNGTLKVNVTGCTLLNTPFAAFTNDSIFGGCYILNNCSEFKFKWIPEKSFCAFKEYKEDTRYDFWRSNFDTIIDNILGFTAPNNRFNWLNPFSVTAGQSVWVGFYTKDGVYHTGLYDISTGAADDVWITGLNDYYVVAHLTTATTGNKQWNFFSQSAGSFIGVPQKDIFTADSIGADVKVSKMTNPFNVGGNTPTLNLTRDGATAIGSNGLMWKTPSKFIDAFGNTYAPHKGTLANKPATLTTDDVGFSYFATDKGTNGAPIYWNGTAWVDASGATV